MAKIAVTRRVQSYKDSMVTSDVWLSSFKVIIVYETSFSTTHDSNNNTIRKQ